MKIITKLVIDGVTKRTQLTLEDTSRSEVRKAMLTRAELCHLDILNALPLIVWKLARQEKTMQALLILDIGKEVANAMPYDSHQLSINGKIVFGRAGFRFDISLVGDDGKPLDWRTLPEKEIKE